MKLRRYRIKIVQHVPESQWVEVEAKTLDEAIQRAYDLVDPDQFEFDSEIGIQDRLYCRHERIE